VVASLDCVGLHVFKLGSDSRLQLACGGFGEGNCGNRRQWHARPQHQVHDAVHEQCRLARSSTCFDKQGFAKSVTSDSFANLFVDER
jgi:hypothetical protein